MSPSPVLFVVIFLVLFAVVLLVLSIGFKLMESQRKSSVSSMLKTAKGEMTLPESDILKNPEDPRTAKFKFEYARLSFFRHLEEMIRQSGVPWTPEGLISAMLFGVAVGLALGSRVRTPVFQQFSMLALSAVLGAGPYLFVAYRRSKRIREFEEQFPEALDFMARSMRAGHAFSVSLEMLADEFPDPLGQEFRIVYHEQNLGSPMDLALTSLGKRVPMVDVRFFISAVLMQRETGGNLAEILTKLAYVIRERFRLKGQVRAASAHGRITAMILTFMPVASVLALTVIAPGYLEAMAKDPDGKYLIVGAITGQVLGYITMRRIVNIKV